MQRRAQIKVYKRQKELQNIDHGSTSSPPTPEAFAEPSGSSDPPEPEHPENIEETSSPPPPEPFPEPSPSPDPQELESQPSISTGITWTPAKTYELDKTITLFLPTPSQASSSFLAPVVPWSDMGLFLYDIG